MKQPVFWPLWRCWRTAEHISGDFAHYAAQIIGSLAITT